MQQLLGRIRTNTVLEYAIVADAITDKTLMDSCLSFILESEHRQESAHHGTWAFSRGMLQNALHQNLCCAVLI